MYFISKYVTANLDVSISIYRIVLVDLSRFYKKYVTAFLVGIGVLHPPPHIHFKIIPTLLGSSHFLKSPIPPPYWKIGHPKFYLLTEMQL